MSYVRHRSDTEFHNGVRSGDHARRQMRRHAGLCCSAAAGGSPPGITPEERVGLAPERSPAGQWILPAPPEDGEDSGRISTAHGSRMTDAHFAFNSV